MKAQNLADLKNRAVAQAIETIRNRIDQLGVSEPVIQEHGLGAVSDSGATAGRGRSGAGEGNHAVHGDAGNQAIAGRALSERASGVAGQGWRAASGRGSDARQKHRLTRHRKRRSLVHHLAGLGGDRPRSSYRGTEHRRKWPAGGALYSYRRGRAQVLLLHFRARRRLPGGGSRQQGAGSGGDQRSDSATPASSTGGSPSNRRKTFR